MPEPTETEIDPHVETYGITAEEAESARAAHEAKSPEDLAYEAGYDAADDSFARRHGLDACPFSPLDHPSERDAWLQGLKAALDEQPSVEALREAVAKETSTDA